MRDLVLALITGVVLALGGKSVWSLFRRIRASRSLGRTIYLEPQRAQELIHAMEKQKEKTLEAIDRGYAARRAEFNSYLDAQRELIIAGHKSKPPPDDPKQ